MKKSSLGDSWFSIYWENSTFKVRSLTSSGRLYGENYFQNFYALNKMLEIKSFQTTYKKNAAREMTDADSALLWLRLAFLQRDTTLNGDDENGQLRGYY